MNHVGASSPNSIFASVPRQVMVIAEANVTSDAESVRETLDFASLFGREFDLAGSFQSAFVKVVELVEQLQFFDVVEVFLAEFFDNGLLFRSERRQIALSRLDNHSHFQTAHDSTLRDLFRVI